MKRVQTGILGWGISARLCLAACLIGLLWGLIVLALQR
jgi:hypothetical protein